MPGVGLKNPYLKTTKDYPIAVNALRRLAVEATIWFIVGIGIILISFIIYKIIKTADNEDWWREF